MDNVIHLEGLKKVFLTDEVETHALAGSTWKSSVANTSHFGTFRLRQVHAAVHSGFAGYAQRGVLHAEWKACSGSVDE